jgi:hypothetical protein
LNAPDVFHISNCQPIPDFDHIAGQDGDRRE